MRFSTGYCFSLEVGAQSLAERLLRLLKDFIGASRGVHLDNLGLLLVVVDDGHARLDEGAEALADALGVVVGAAAGLAALEQALLHGLLGAVVEEDELGRADRLLELVRLVELAGEAVDEEAALGGVAGGGEVGLHGVLEQLDGDLHGHNQAVLDVVADEVAELRALAVLLGAEEVTRGQVAEAVRVDELAALGALAGAGTAEDEDDGDVLGVEGRGRLTALGGRHGGRCVLGEGDLSS